MSAKHDRIATTNQRHWEWAVQKGAGCTVPWLDLNAGALRAFARGDLDPVPDEWRTLYPPELLRDVGGLDVLCLASGGGQQTAVFGLLGANVTVLDLTEGQLAGDRKTAAHYGYDLRAIQGDMRDLSCLQDSAFDMVYQGNCMAWVPDARQVYRQVHRVLKPGATYRVDFSNPATEFIDFWDGEAYRLTRPYMQKEMIEVIGEQGEPSLQFRHHMDEIFNGLLELDFSIQQVRDAPEYFVDRSHEPQGSWKHSQMFLGSFAIVATKS